jgi:plasmid maintenance system killer protein
MDIIFHRAGDREAANNDAKLRKQFRGNARRANLVRARLDELADADTLEVMRSIPQAYCHELTGDRKGQVAVKLDGRYRLIFGVANNPVPRKPDGGLDWTNVTQIEIVELAVDYHEKKRRK